MRGRCFGSSVRGKFLSRCSRNNTELLVQCRTFPFECLFPSSVILSIGVSGACANNSGGSADETCRAKREVREGRTEKVPRLVSVDVMRQEVRCDMMRQATRAARNSLSSGKRFLRRKILAVQMSGGRRLNRALPAKVRTFAHDKFFFLSPQHKNCPAHFLTQSQEKNIWRAQNVPRSSLSRSSLVLETLFRVFCAFLHRAQLCAVKRVTGSPWREACQPQIASPGCGAQCEPAATTAPHTPHGDALRVAVRAFFRVRSCIFASKIVNFVLPCVQTQSPKPRCVLEPTRCPQLAIVYRTKTERN